MKAIAAPMACKGKVISIEPNSITVTLFPDPENESDLEITGEVKKEDLPAELHKPGAIFDYEAKSSEVYQFSPVPIKKLTQADIEELQKESLARFTGDV